MRRVVSKEIQTLRNHCCINVAQDVTQNVTEGKKETSHTISDVNLCLDKYVEAE